VPDSAPALSDGANGIGVTRSILVGELVSIGAGRIYEAIQACGVNRGDSLPGVPDVVCVERSATMLDTSTARVMLSYRIAQPEDNIITGASGQVEITTTVSARETEQDINGKQIAVEHTFENVDSTTGEITEDLQRQIRTVTVPEARSIETYTRIESDNPRDMIREYSGTVNRTKFLDRAERTWFLIIQASSNDGGRTFVVRYAFEHRLETWDAEVVFLDRATGEPPIDIKAGIGRIQPHILTSKDFWNLDLV
tara:strand:+ start:579 stop:1337 length:759 start_codon:yes stop_codon:yes gene_type:complete